MFTHRNRNSFENDASETSSPWSSYSDMMAALVLVFVLIMFYFVYQNLEMTEINEQLYTEQMQALTEQQTTLDEQSAENLLLIEQVNAQQEQLDAQQEQLDIQQDQLYIQQEQLDTQQEQLEQLIGVRANIIAALTESLKSAGLQVAVDQQTGAITLDSSIMFNSASSNLSNDGREFLDQFLPLYIGVLMNEDNRPYISEIIVEGHTDTVGSYLYNLDLSQQRALTVVSYFLNDNNPIFTDEMKNTLRGIVTANGRSFSNPIYDAEGNVDLNASRRVEFKFRLRDTEMIDSMMQILEGTEE